MARINSSHKQIQSKGKRSILFLLFALMLGIKQQYLPISIERRSYNFSSWDREFSVSCPLSVVKNRGIYKAREASSWDNVVLITAANFGFYDMLQNWEFLAGKHRLRWSVAAMDDSLYEKLGPNRAFFTTAMNSVRNASSYHSPGFNIVTCNKIRMVLMVLDNCELDVVFSDTDVAFMKDPFSHDFGDLIQTGKYDYIYQLNYGNADAPRQHIEMGKGSNGMQEKLSEVNTGFHYLSNRSQVLRNLLRNTLTVCREKNYEQDDQVILWNLLKEIDYRLCDKPEVDAEWSSQFNREGNDVLSMCYLDPYFYRVGKPKPKEYMKKDTVVFHANFVHGKESKIRSLQHQTLDGYGW
eukprot:CAMPEP_0113631576 /NCGR_PEP_ID=MMETSP0017_2-20120614/16409_1 /TAXON_ID=2856 /ORGANISM="Cylindrotheca closterium" /LENGTH=352 /DNA_ID=CAMNT_0000542091 /DNA_START=92 /DNA_END=1147 /DNA_ORIENTATION=- /assembly_acc=CAM_ASM_000147